MHPRFVDPLPAAIIHTPLTDRNRPSARSGNLTMWHRLSTPVKIGLACAALGISLTLIGMARGNVPMRPASIGMALLIGGGVWFVVAWAVATAAVDVEEDLAGDEIISSAGEVGQESGE
ncbi:MAG: hypothetical protein HC802_16375 [Caldilineaceae bacterium]|nr:hypothetical protein [Caldilineaceae bacterium]